MTFLGVVEERGQSLGGDDQLHTGRGTFGKHVRLCSNRTETDVETSVTMSEQVVLELDVVL